MDGIKLLAGCAARICIKIECIQFEMIMFFRIMHYYAYMGTIYKICILLYASTLVEYQWGKTQTLTSKIHFIKFNIYQI